jgi:hypothetical protein
MSKVSRQKPAQAGPASGEHGEAVRAHAGDETCGPRYGALGIGSAASGSLLAAALTRENMQQALKRVKANKGAAGVDGLDIAQTIEHLRTHWPQIRQRLLQGNYRPNPVRRVPRLSGPQLYEIRRDSPLSGNGIKCQDWLVEVNLKPLKGDPHAGWCGRGAVNGGCPLCRLADQFSELPTGDAVRAVSF